MIYITNKKKLLFFLIMILGIVNVIRADNINLDKIFNLKTYSVNEGLSQFSANRIKQDKYGFVWVVTWDGLNRYDGNGFVQYRHDPFDPTSLGGNRVVDMMKDNNDDLWLFIENGTIDRYDRNSDQFEHFEFEPLKSSVVMASFQDREGHYWMGTTNGLYRASLKGQKFVVEQSFLKSSYPSLKTHVISMEQADNGDIYIGTTSGLNIYSPMANGEYSHKSLLDSIVINSIYKDNRKNIWICTDKGLFFIDNEKNTHKVINIGTGELTDVRAMVQIDQNNAVILHRTGASVLCLNEHSITELKVADKSFFYNNRINNAIIDHTKNIWIASLLKGIAKIDLYQPEEIITRKEDTEGMFVRAIFKDSKERVWLGTNFAGLNYFDQDGVVKNLPVSDIERHYILTSPSIEEDINGNIWFSINDQLYCYDYSDRQLLPLQKLYNIKEELNKPCAIELDSFGSMWVGCSDGLVRFHMADNQIITEKIPLKLSDWISSEQIIRILHDRIHNIVWVCTKNDGISALWLDNKGTLKKTQHFIRTEQDHSLNSNHVWSVTISPDSTVWFGTDSGLIRCEVSNDQIMMEPVNSLKQIGYKKIMSLTDDGNGHLWIGTTQAMYSYNYKTGIERSYTVDNGLYANTVPEGMFLDGRTLYASNINGLNIINTATKPQNPYPVEVAVTDFRISGKSIKNESRQNKRFQKFMESEKIELKYNESSFTIDFLALHYNNSGDNMYQYQLEGYDSDPFLISGQNHSVTYNRVPSGKYHFWVRASYNENDWSENTKQITIVVKPAPWLSTWAILIYITSGVILLYWIYHYLTRQARLKQEIEIKEIENRRQEEINNIKLRFHSNIAHDIRTPITLIAAPLGDILNEKAVVDNLFIRERVTIIHKNVERLLYLVNQFLDYSDSNKVNLEIHDAESFLTNTIQLFQGAAMSGNINFGYIIDLSDKELIFDGDKISKILINLISNAFKCTSSGDDVYVFIEQQNDSLIIKVEDSGRGISKDELPNIFDRYYQSKQSSYGSGIGLALVKQLTELCGGTISVESKPGEGSLFTVLMPCRVPEPANDSELYVKMETRKQEPLDDYLSSVKPKLLIVEDDPDLRDYLRKCFGEDYTIIEAEDGQIGFDMALRYTPDLILSDIIMPNIGGMTMIELLHKDHRTSHIPIIVLASKSSDIVEIEALQIGAEDFIYKPFSTKVLRLKINNTINKHLKKYEIKNDDQAEANVHGQDRAFLSKMNELILENLENPLFSIEFLCEHLSISRMQLHRKMKILLNKSTSEYIREIKLDQAKKIFENGETDIESVMMMIGFSSIYHFNQNFKARFGISPREFIKSDHKKQTK